MMMVVVPMVMMMVMAATTVFIMVMMMVIMVMIVVIAIWTTDMILVAMFEEMRIIFERTIKAEGTLVKNLCQVYTRSACLIDAC